MADTRMILIPFNLVNSKEHVDSSQQWNRIIPKHIFCMDSNKLAKRLGELKDASDVLYIRGHCCAGSSKLESSDHRKTISASDLVAALAGKLDTAFPGKIKLYGCSTSEGWGPSMWRYEAFAQQFADLMWKGRYRRCGFYGYSTSVTTYSFAKGNLPHRWSGEDPKAPWDPEMGEPGVRASVVRKEIFPNTEKMGGYLLPI